MSDYSEKLRNPKWQRKRLEVFERDKWKCLACGEMEETLHVHHLIYAQWEPWDAPLDTLETLCEECHELRERFNAFCGGRSELPTKVALHLFDMIKPAFDGSMDVTGISILGHLIKRAADRTLVDQELYIALIPKGAMVRINGSGQERLVQPEKGSEEARSGPGSGGSESAGATPSARPQVGHLEFGKGAGR